MVSLYFSDLSRDYPGCVTFYMDTQFKKMKNVMSIPIIFKSVTNSIPTTKYKYFPQSNDYSDQVLDVFQIWDNSLQEIDSILQAFIVAVDAYRSSDFGREFDDKYPMFIQYLKILLRRSHTLHHLRIGPEQKPLVIDRKESNGSNLPSTPLKQALTEYWYQESRANDVTKWIREVVKFDHLEFQKLFPSIKENDYSVWFQNGNVCNKILKDISCPESNVTIKEFLLALQKRVIVRKDTLHKKIDEGKLEEVATWLKVDSSDVFDLNTLASGTVTASILVEKPRSPKRKNPPKKEEDDDAENCVICLTQKGRVSSMAVDIFVSAMIATQILHYVPFVARKSFPSLKFLNLNFYYKILLPISYIIRYNILIFFCCTTSIHTRHLETSLA